MLYNILGFNRAEESYKYTLSIWTLQGKLKKINPTKLLGELI